MRYANNASTYLELLGRCAASPGCIRTDIASFRLGAHPALPDFLNALGGPIRLLIGVNTLQDSAESDVCLAVAEEMVCKMGKRLEARVRPGCHVKGAYFAHRASRSSVALLGSANLCTGHYDEFVVPVSGEAAFAFRDHFTVLWATATPIKPSPLTLSIVNRKKS